MITARAHLFHFEKILITVESGDLWGEKSQLGNIQELILIIFLLTYLYYKLCVHQFWKTKEKYQ